MGLDLGYPLEAVVGEKSACDLKHPLQPSTMKRAYNIGREVKTELLQQNNSFKTDGPE